MLYTIILLPCALDSFILSCERSEQKRADFSATVIPDPFCHPRPDRGSRSVGVGEWIPAFAGMTMGRQSLR